jgi:hypothetical protein
MGSLEIARTSYASIKGLLEKIYMHLVKTIHGYK